MAQKPVVIFGAGATKACGGPLTNEILPQAFDCRAREVDSAIFNREGFLDLVEEFLTDNFRLQPSPRDAEDYPPLPLLLSMVDIAVDRRHAFGPTWGPDRLRQVREALQYLIFGLLEHQLRTTIDNWYREMLELVWPEPGVEPATISLNYDLILDNALIQRSERLFGVGRFPDYACDVATPFYRERPERYGQLLKLHGSLNWLYCPGCGRLDVGIAQSGWRMAKVLQELWHQEPHHQLEKRYSCGSTPCPDTTCLAQVQPVLITPTHRKDYRNPHVSGTWYRAERLLRHADRVFIVGYSLPEDDVDVIYLLRRGLAHLDPREITVIEMDKRHRSLRDHPVGQRYRAVFGNEVDWRTEGFGAWINGHRKRGLSPLSARLPKSGTVARDELMGCLAD